MPFNHRVLCVDDYEDTCALVRATLSEWDVTAVNTCDQALRVAASEEFDLILLDYHLPDGNGLELCSQIRAFDVSTPILIVTATHSIEHERALANGAQGVMRKDHLTHLLPAAVAHAIELRVTP